MKNRNPIQRVLVAVDFSDLARHAFYQGIQLATNYNAETHILHVSEPLRSFDFGKRKYVETKETIERVEEGIRERLDELWTAGGEAAVDRRKVHIIVRGGRAAQEIIDTSVAKNIDLIVMGAGGSSGAAVGSTAERVVRNAACSVLTIRNPKGAT